MLPERRTIWILGVILCGAIVVVAIVVAHHGEQAPAYSPPQAVFTTPSTALITSSQQKSVDTGLSLAPSSPSSATTSAPSPTYAGCKLYLTFTTTAGSVQAAGPMSYILAAKNIGSAPCESASISAYYANNETFVSSSPRAAVDGYYWQFGNLTAGKEIDIGVMTDRSAPLDAGDSTNEACLSATNGVDSCANSAPFVQAVSALSSQHATPMALATATISLAPQSGKELGVWVWTPLDQLSSTTMEQVVDEVVTNNFNAIYVTVDEYVAISQIPDTATRVQQLQNYEQDVTEFLNLAAAKNISVDAEAGSPDWAEPSNQWEPEKIMAFVAAYNESHTIKFRGVQYDIEPYLLPTYTNNESSVLTDYVQLIAALAPQAGSDGLPLTIVVPDFYGAALQWTPQVTVGGVTDYTYAQILRILGKLPNGRVIVMAYRNFAAGSDGSIALSDEEVHDADKTNVHVLIAQETGPVSPEYVTFYGMTKSQLAGQVALVNQAFDQDSSFGGIAIDYIDPFLKLAE